MYLPVDIATIMLHISTIQGKLDGKHTYKPNLSILSLTSGKGLKELRLRVRFGVEMPSCFRGNTVPT